MKPLIGLVPFLRANGVAVDEVNLKVHLACWNGKEDPINGYYAGVFKEWQEEQTRKNFECAQVLSLIDIEPENGFSSASTVSQSPPSPIRLGRISSSTAPKLCPGRITSSAGLRSRIGAAAPPMSGISPQ